MSLKILILGANGFIGNSLTEHILKKTDWSIFAMDIQDDRLKDSLKHPRFNFLEGDITINKEWIEYHIKKCDVIIPLVAIANPAIYVKDPLSVFELDFEENLKIIRQCVKYKKRIIFPSTSEVYGMSKDKKFDEEKTNLVLGPICKQRWIYSCSKQLIDRVIFAYGFQKNLQYTIFRPFNWLGPKLDSLSAEKEGSARVVTQFLSNILHHGEIKLVNGGLQRRSFTYIDDGINALLKIIENQNNCANHKIFNIGNPDNDISIKDLAKLILKLVEQYPSYRELAKKIKITEIPGDKHFGKYYEDVSFRVPSIEKTKNILNWQPQINIEIALKRTLDYHLSHSSKELLS